MRRERIPLTEVFQTNTQLDKKNQWLKQNAYILHIYFSFYISSGTTQLLWYQRPKTKHNHCDTIVNTKGYSYNTRKKLLKKNVKYFFHKDVSIFLLDWLFHTWVPCVCTVPKIAQMKFACPWPPVAVVSRTNNYSFALPAALKLLLIQTVIPVDS